MEVILLERVPNLGKLGDVVRVKEGYGRNFLLPQGKAKRATKSNIAEFEQKKAELEKRQGEILAKAIARGEKLSGYLLQITQKAGVDGRLFGSVSSTEIAEILVQQGFEVTKSEVRMPNGHLKVIGNHSVHLVLHHDVTVEITVSVLGET